MGASDKANKPVRSTKWQRAKSNGHLRHSSERALIQAKDALERRTEELAHSLSMMQATLDSTTDAIVVTDLVGNVTDFNEKYAEMLGLPREVVASSDVQQLRILFSRQLRDPEQFLVLVREIYASSPPESFDLLEFADGRVFERYSKIQTIDKRSVGRVWSFRDITERKRGEERLEAAKVAAEQASRAKDHFLAVLSHELRTPLTPALVAASYLAEHEDLPREFREEATAVWQNVQLEAHLIDDLLDMTRIARGKMQMHHEIVDAHRLLQNAVQIVQKDMGEKKLELVIDFRATGHHIWADPVRIQQVFWNLLNNAVKFTPPGGRITIASLNKGKQFVFEISDTGIGIEPEKQDCIFEAFDQGERSITRQFGGLGLGLTISKALLDLHGGTISVQSQGKNQGTTFRVFLDLLREPSVTAISAVKNDVTPLRSLRLLLVDDHADTRHVLSRLLAKYGHEVATANSVQGALELLESGRFDALISDIGLPDGDGYHLVREAKRRQPLKAVALSGFGTGEDIRRSLEAGFDFHVTKPIDFGGLRSLLHKITKMEEVPPAQR